MNPKQPSRIARGSAFARLGLVLFLLQSCGGGGGGGGAAAPAPTPTVTVSFGSQSYSKDVTDRSASEALLTLAATASNDGSVSYAITVGNSDGYFAINSGSGAITLTSTGMSSAPVGRYSLTVTATLGSVSATAMAVINLPDFIRFTQASLSATPNFRNTSDAIATLEAKTSADVAVAAYSITAGNSDGYFAIDNSGRVSFTTAGISAPAGDYTLTVEGSSAGIPAAQATVMVSIGANTVIFAQSSYSASTGDVYATSALVTVSATAAGTLSYSITAGDTPGYFAIDAASGALTISAQGSTGLSTGSYSLTVRAVSDDTAVMPGDVMVQITITPAVVLPMSSLAASPMHRDASMEVATVEARLTDGMAVSYSITGGNTQGYFQIDASSGRISFTTAGLAAGAGTHSLTVSVDDAAGDAAVPAVNVTVMVALGAIISFSQTMYNLTPAHRDLFLPIVTLSATASDGADVSYSIRSGDERGFFEVRANGEVNFTRAGKTSAGPSQQMLMQGQTRSYTLTIDASDESGAGSHTLVAPAVVMISLGDIIMPDPASASHEIMARQFNTTADLVFLSGRSESGLPISIAISAGNDEGWFTFNESTSHIRLARLDFSPPSTAVELTVDLSVSTGLAVQVPVSITFASDIARTLALDMSSYTFNLSVADPTAAPANPVMIGSLPMVTRTGVDANAALSYALVSCGTPCPFAIDAATGQMSLTGATSEAMRRDGQQVLTLQASVADNAISPATATVTVVLAPVLLFLDDANAAISSAHSISIESPSMGSSIAFPAAKVLPGAREGAFTVSYTLSSAADNGGGDAASLFSLTSSGTLTWAMDGDSKPSYTVNIAASAVGSGDFAGTTLNDTIELSLGVPDTIAPTISGDNARPLSFVHNEVMVGQAITTVTASDNRDSADAITLSITSNPNLTNGALARLNGKELQWNVVPVAADIRSDYTLSVEATDSAGNRTEQSLDYTIAITAPNALPKLARENNDESIIGRADDISELAGVRDVEVITSGDSTFAYALTSTGIDGFTLATDDTSFNTMLSPIDQFARIAQADGHSLASSETTLFLSVSGASADFVRSYSVGADGALTQASQVDDSSSIELDGASQMLVESIRDKTVVCVAASEDDGIAVLELGSNGVLSHEASISDADHQDLGLDDITSLAVNGNFIYAGGSEGRISVIGATLDASNNISLAYLRHHAGTSTVPLGAGLSLAVVANGSARALAVATDGATKSMDGLHLIPIDTSAQSPMLDFSKAVSRLDGSTDSLRALGDPLSLATFAIGTGSPSNMIGITTADRGGAFLQFLASFAAGSWTLSDPLSLLTDQGSDSSYMLASPRFVARHEDLTNRLIADIIASPTDGALTVMQTTVVTFDNISGTYDIDGPPTIADLWCRDNECARVSGVADAFVQDIVSVGEAEFNDIETVSAGNTEKHWRLTEKIATDGSMSAIDEDADRYLLSVPLTDAGGLSVRYMIPLGEFLPAPEI